MKSKFGYLIIGVAIGFFIRSHWFQERAEEPSVALTEDSVPVAPSSSSAKPAQRVVEVRPSRVENNGASKSTVKVIPSTPAQKERPLVRAEPDTIHGLVINEENVSEMERHRDQLRNYAFTVQTAEGWRIQILPEDRVFMKAGLSSGDLITFESMDGQLQRSDRAQLAARLVAIFNTIQR